MAITFVSTAAAKKSLIETDEYGRDRVCTAERDPTYNTNGVYSPSRWKIELLHPNGDAWQRQHIGSDRDVLSVMGQLMDAKQQEFRRTGDKVPYDTQKSNVGVLTTAPVRTIR